MRNKQTYEFTNVTLVLDLDDRLVTPRDDLERPVLLITLDLRVLEFTSDETFSVEDRVLRVRVESVLCGITDTENKV